MVADLVATAVAATPGVAGLSGGVFGSIATYLPGRRLLGVRIGEPGEPVEIGVVVTMQAPIPATVRALRRAVSGVVGPGTEIDVTVADVVGAPAGAGPAIVVDGPTVDPAIDPAAARRRRVL